MDQNKHRLTALEVVDRMRDTAGGMIPLAEALSAIPLKRDHARNLYNSLKNSANAGHLPVRRMEAIQAFCIVHGIPCDKDHFVTNAARERLERLKAEAAA